MHKVCCLSCQCFGLIEQRAQFSTETEAREFYWERSGWYCQVNLDVGLLICLLDSENRILEQVYVYEGSVRSMPQLPKVLMMEK